MRLNTKCLAQGVACWCPFVGLGVMLLMLVACEGGADFPQAKKFLRFEQLPEVQTAVAKTYHHHCSQCHALFDPTQLAAHQWGAVVAVMNTKARQANKKVLNQKQVASVVNYLERHASDVTKP